MDMNRYCRTCGHHISFESLNATGYCPICDREIERKNTIMGCVKDTRIKQLKAMHELMCLSNDECVYSSWVYTMPDCPTEDDFICMAMDDDDYNACFDAFVKLIKYDGNRW